MISRWPITIIFLAASLGGCEYTSLPDPAVSALDADYIAKVPDFQVDRQYERYRVDDPTGEIPGTIVIDTHDNYLYFVEPNKKRYATALRPARKRPAGRASLGLVERRNGRTGCTGRYARALAAFETRRRMQADCPVALTIRSAPERCTSTTATRTLFTGFMGLIEPEKIGHSVSSGCIRMRNIDVIDLYDRIPIDTRVVVR